MLINLTYFVGELSIPNTDSLPVQERIDWFIKKYEPELLQKLFGYEFYKAFIAGITVVSPTTIDQRWLDLIYGVEYTNRYNRLAKWRGLIDTEAPVYSFGNGLKYKPPVLIQAGVSTINTTETFPSGINTATVTDWIGWKIIPERIGQGTLKENIDYTWNPLTGVWTLLHSGDIFQVNEYFFIQFQLQTEDTTDLIYSFQQSLIALYVYYWYMRAIATQTTGIGEIQTLPEGATQASGNRKMCTAWNQMVDWIYELYEYLDASTTIYPEYITPRRRRYCWYDDFRVINSLSV